MGGNLNFKLLVFISILFTYLTTYSQDKLPQEQIIADTFVNYFSLERENIHLHFNKEVFLTDESIWFKGYILNRKEHLPFYYTTNIIVGLYNETGELLEQKFVFGSSGYFFNSFKLSKKYASGNYYIRAHTNWMNNFSENESSIFKVVVINADEKNINQFIKPKYNSIEISIVAEGGKLIKNVQNPLTVKISNCNNPIQELTNCQLINITTGKVQELELNRNGMVKFNFLPDGNFYKITANYNDQIFEKEIPQPASTGISLELNNYSSSTNTTVVIKTNKETLPSISGKNFFAAIHQDNQVSVVKFSFKQNELETALIIPKNKLFPGTNQITIIDDELKEVAQRLFFIQPPASDKAIVMKYNLKDNKIQIKGRTHLKSGNLSISMLHPNVINATSLPSLTTNFLINDKLKSKVSNINQYFENPSKQQIYELDLFFIHQFRPKYTWTNIYKNIPNDKYPFEIGLNLRGKIQTDVPEIAQHQMHVRSQIFNISEHLDLTDIGEFNLTNQFFLDSTRLDFGLYRVNGKIIKSQQTIKAINSKNFKFKVDSFIEKCQRIAYNDPVPVDLPNIYREIINIEEVKIKANIAQNLKYASRLGNSNLRGEKIPANYRGDIVRYLTMNNFDAFTQMGELFIYGRGIISLNGARTSPAVFVDDIQLHSFNHLLTINMKEIDEIFLNGQAIVPGMTHYNGLIKIYLKPHLKGAKKDTSNYNEQIISGAYAKSHPYTPAQFLSYTDKGFENFGIYDWIPNILTDENGNFEITIDKPKAEKILLKIEGMGFDGSIMSDEIPLTIQ